MWAVQLLLKSGADPNIPDQNGQTALHLAVGTGEPAGLTLLQSLTHCLKRCHSWDIAVGCCVQGTFRWCVP